MGRGGRRGTWNCELLLYCVVGCSCMYEYRYDDHGNSMHGVESTDLVITGR
jgi:hypothetical protein